VGRGGGGRKRGRKSEENEKRKRKKMRKKYRKRRRWWKGVEPPEELYTIKYLNMNIYEVQIQGATHATL